MFNYFIKRLLGLTPTLLIVAVLVFFFVHMLPGDPARLAAGIDADEQTVQLVRQELGLDKPLPEQFHHDVACPIAQQGRQREPQPSLNPARR